MTGTQSLLGNVFAEGTIRTDDGRELSYDAAALGAFRRLRIGQRVRIVVHDGAVTRLELPN